MSAPFQQASGRHMEHMSMLIPLFSVLPRNKRASWTSSLKDKRNKLIQYDYPITESSGTYSIASSERNAGLNSSIRPNHRSTIRPFRAM
ncbi:hypothetical protein OPQ81_005997 [Rhizoctonia solani]|nr:hypothetical protein OPQ81_005997 [Rhizoctonia solani]